MSGYPGGESGLLAALAAAELDAGDFGTRYRGQVAGLGRGRLIAALGELARFEKLIILAGSYGDLRLSARETDVDAQLLSGRVDQLCDQIRDQLTFFDLELGAVDVDLASSPDGAFASSRLRTALRRHPHVLPEADERTAMTVLATLRDSWFMECTDAEDADEVALAGGWVTRDDALATLNSPVHDSRRGAAAALTAAMRPHLQRRATALTAIMTARFRDANQRRYADVFQELLDANELDARSGQRLLAAAHARAGTARRYWELKAKLLGVEVLSDYDLLHRPFDRFLPGVPWDAAYDLVLGAFADFSPLFAQHVRETFARHRIDAEARHEKRFGSFSYGTVPSVGPYVAVSYRSLAWDVGALGNALGRAAQYWLADSQSIFNYDTFGFIGDAVGLFGEALVIDRLLGQSPNADHRLGLLAGRVERSIRMVFEGRSFHEFERLAYEALPARGVLTPDQLGDLWTRTRLELVGDSVQITPDYRDWWSLVHEFGFENPGSYYVNVHAGLLALLFWREYRRDKEAFAARYVEMLTTGRSLPPDQLLRMVGIDVDDPAIWDTAIDVIEAQIKAMEAAAGEAGLL
jgi:oligoendopeptidase F